ncbi:MAG: carboxypeptidase-like regulatory domain-containing protein [Patescibacteria group bacterium]
MSTRTIIALLILAGAIVAIRYDKKSATTPITPIQIACTQEAKQCPDGSYVGRTGPQCQFAECPKSTPVPLLGTGIVNGVITTSPSCGGPVRMPPDPNCGPKPYQTTISFFSSTSKPYKTSSDSNGKYSIKLPAGTYKVQAEGGQTLPSCPEEAVVVQSNKTVTKDIDCDSGIR